MAQKKQASSNNIINLVLVALLCLPAGYLIGNAVGSSSVDTDEHHAATHNESHGSSHGTYEVPENAPAPLITSFEVTKDAKSGWNVSLTTENFEFSPENASSEHVDGQGHAHIYVDGVKLTRLYGNNYYIGHLDEGMREISITLNTNDHRDYTVNSKPIEASTIVSDAHHSIEM